MRYKFGLSSGGHINPAVTFAFFLAQKISLIRGILYIVVQVSQPQRLLGSISVIQNPGSSFFI